MLQHLYRRLHRWSLWLLWGGIILSFYGTLITTLPRTRALEWLFHIETSNTAGMVLLLMVCLVTPLTILTQVTQWRVMLLGVIAAEVGVLYFGRLVIAYILEQTTRHGVIAGFIPKLSIKTPWETLQHESVVFLLINASMILWGGLFTMVAALVILIPPRAEAEAEPVYWGYPE